MKKPKPHSTVVKGRWLVITGDTGTDLSGGKSALPLTWMTTVTDSTGKWPKRVMDQYPNESVAKRGHNAVIKHLKGGGYPNNYKDN